MNAVSIVHDYLTQRGGAERLVLSLARTFSGAPIYTSFYDPANTFPEYRGLEVRPMHLDAIGVLRHNHRLALPLLASAFSRLEVAGGVVICSSSGWAHGTHVRGRKLVYCHAPARWLYQAARYRPRQGAGAVALAVLRRPLLRWDRRSAATADRYVVNSRATCAQVAEIYGIEAEVVPPPHSLDASGPQERVEGLEPGFVLCVSRLLPYKNVGAVVAAFEQLPGEQLVVAGDGPEHARLVSRAPTNVRFVGRVSDAGLRWLYANSGLLVAAAYEDFGLTPVEAASFGVPAVALRFGGYLDTVVEGETGLLFAKPEGAAIRDGIHTALGHRWNQDRLRSHAEMFSAAAFGRRMKRLVAELVE